MLRIAGIHTVEAVAVALRVTALAVAQVVLTAPDAIPVTDCRDYPTVINNIPVCNTITRRHHDVL